MPVTLGISLPIPAMPTIHRENGFRFFFFSNENDEEPHIHVEKSGGVAKLNLQENINFIWVRGFSKLEQSRLLKITELHSAKFINLWHAYFDTHK